MSHTPGPWEQLPPTGAATTYIAIRQSESHVMVADVIGSSKDVNANAKLIAAAPDLLESLKELLADVTGPAMVYGDGRGSDGKKTGLSHQEFNELRARRISAARAAIAKAEEQG